MSANSPAELGFTRRAPHAAIVVPDLGDPPPLSAALPLHGLCECHDCGATADDPRRPLTTWQEHERNARGMTVALPVYVILCEACAERLFGEEAAVNGLARLYRRLRPHEPAPGAMPICANCRFRAGSVCHHARSLARGGPGVRLDYPASTWERVQDYDEGGRRRERSEVRHTGPVWGCDQKKLPGPLFPQMNPARLL